jgi:hypothetical protein
MGQPDVLALPEPPADRAEASAAGAREETGHILGKALTTGEVSAAD